MGWHWQACTRGKRPDISELYCNSQGKHKARGSVPEMVQLQESNAAHLGSRGLPARQRSGHDEVVGLLPCSQHTAACAHRPTQTHDCLRFELRFQAALRGALLAQRKNTTIEEEKIREKAHLARPARPWRAARRPAGRSRPRRGCGGSGRPRWRGRAPGSPGSPQAAAACRPWRPPAAAPGGALRSTPGAPNCMDACKGCS